MKGVKPHKKTGILWLRLRTPHHLIERRADLEALGVDFRVEHHRSLGTKDRREAISAYAEKLLEIEGIWERWEALLRDGPQVLTHRNIVALAGEQAKRFLDAHEDDPFDAPAAPDIPEPSFDEAAWSKQMQRLSSAERADFKADLTRYLAADDKARQRETFAILTKHPWLKSLLKPTLAATLELMHGAETDAAVNEKGLYIDRITRRLLNLEMAGLMGTARRGLEQRQQGDWGEVDGLHNLPTFEAPSRTGIGSRERPSELTFEAVIDEQERLSGLKLDKQRKAARTIKKYREDCRRFCEWRSSENILTVSAKEVAKWRDEMIALADAGGMKRKTIILRITALSAVIGWAIRHNKRRRSEGESIPELFANGNPLRGIDLPAKEKIESEERTLTKEMARIILRATRTQKEASRRWALWLIIYSGMRIGEVEQLEKRDVMSSEGCWYLMVRSDDERTTKTHQSRRIPLHRAIVAEGFLDFVDAAPEGRLFPAKRMNWIVRAWVHKVMEPHGGFDGRPPLHSARHLFGDLATGKMDLAARYYIEGRAFPGSGRDYGRSAAMVPELSRMMNEIESLLPMPPS